MLTIAQVFVLLLLQAVPLVMLGAVAGISWMRRRDARHAEPLADPVANRLADLSAAIERIERSLSRSGSVPSRETAEPAPGVRADRPAQSPLPSPCHRPRRGDSAPERPRPGPTLIRVPDLTGPGRVVGSQAEAARNTLASNDLARRFARIWAMADQGAPADRIAEASGQPIGQVELVLNLRRRLLDDPSVEVPE
ncbi:hypothetical protein AB1L88_11095 [Tautonia sp. JC769]|uniref:hypothetical protein n=1 Tax=Tautonia sp. JC769 TaxID=3232135 RepID=UPI003459A3DF